ncbi:MAG TPA: hypothetical protein VGN12_25740 [Pirellulales bacterium]|jgi:WD40 repeat protein
MKLLLLAIALFLSCCDNALALDLVPDAVLGTPVPERQSHPRTYVNSVEWAGSKLVCAGGAGFVRCYDPETRERLWFVSLASSVGSLAIDEAAGKVFVLEEGHRLNVYRLADGKPIAKYTDKDIGKRAGKAYVMSTAIACSPRGGRLLITDFGKDFNQPGSLGLLFNVDLRLTGRATVEGFVNKASFDSTGRYLVTVNSHSNNVRIWDCQANREIFKIGEDRDVIETDTEHLSDARFDGDRTLVVATNGAWLLGSTISIVDIHDDVEKASFMSQIHVALDVDFVHGHIAVGGSENDLAIHDMSGKLLALKKNGALQRIEAVRFSPDGKRIAIGSADGTARTFLLKAE